MCLRTRSRRLVILAATLAAGSLGCRVAFGLIGSRVDARGVLCEPFALLPISALLLLGSGVALIAAWLLRSRRH
ncbi:MAG: DUF3955 domain-containing protein [Cyanobium sp.]